MLDFQQIAYHQFCPMCRFFIISYTSNFSQFVGFYFCPFNIQQFQTNCRFSYNLLELLIVRKIYTLYDYHVTKTPRRLLKSKDPLAKKHLDAPFFIQVFCFYLYSFILLRPMLQSNIHDALLLKMFQIHPKPSVSYLMY